MGGPHSAPAELACASCAWSRQWGPVGWEWDGEWGGSGLEEFALFPSPGGTRRSRRERRHPVPWLGVSPRTPGPRRGGPDHPGEPHSSASPRPVHLSLFTTPVFSTSHALPEVEAKAQETGDPSVLGGAQGGRRRARLACAPVLRGPRPRATRVRTTSKSLPWGQSKGTKTAGRGDSPCAGLAGLAGGRRRRQALVADARGAAL